MSVTHIEMFAPLTEEESSKPKTVSIAEPSKLISMRSIHVLPNRPSAESFTTRNQSSKAEENILPAQSVKQGHAAAR